MEQKLRDSVYQLVTESDPDSAERLTFHSHLRLHFETVNKRMSIAKEDGFITVTGFERNHQQWNERCEFEFLPVAEKWFVMGMKHEHHNMIINEEQELSQFIQFVTDFKEEFFLQFGS